MVLGCEEVINDLRHRLARITSGHYVAVLLFGSWARCEAGEESDVDLLVLHRGLGGIDRARRGRAIYLAVSAFLRNYQELTVLDMDFDEFVRPRVVSPLLLNIYWDSVVILDRTGELGGFLDEVRRRIVESGLRRVRDGKAYYWLLPKPMERVRIV